MSFSRLSILLLITLLWVYCAEGQTIATGDESATLTLRSNIDHMLVVVDSTTNSYELIQNGGSLQLSEGRHTVLLTGRRASDTEFDINIEAGKSYTFEENLHVLDPEQSPLRYLYLSSYPALRYGANAALLSGPGSVLYVDSKRVGVGSEAVMLGPGEHTIRAVDVYGRTAERHIRVTRQFPPRLQRIELYTRPDPVVGRLMSVIPGAAQFYKNDSFKGTAFVGGMLASIGVVLWQNARFLRNRSAYTGLISQYDSALSADEAARIGSEMQHHYEGALQARDVRDFTVKAGIVLYALNVLDGVLWPPSGGWRKVPTVNWAPALAQDGAGVRFTVTY